MFSLNPTKWTQSARFSFGPYTLISGDRPSVIDMVSLAVPSKPVSVKDPSAGMSIMPQYGFIYIFWHISLQRLFILSGISLMTASIGMAFSQIIVRNFLIRPHCPPLF